VQHVEKNPLHEWKEEVEFSSLRVKGYEVNDIAVFLRVEYAKGLHFHVEFFLIWQFDQQTSQSSISVFSTDWLKFIYDILRGDEENSFGIFHTWLLTSLRDLLYLI